MAKGENNLLILSKHAVAYKNLVRSAELPGIVAVEAAETVEEAEAGLAASNIIFGDPDLLREALPLARKVEWVQSSWAGIMPLMGQGCRTDYLLTGIKDVFGPVMSEFVFCYMLMHERKAMIRHQAQQNCRWDDTNPGKLQGKTLAILGVGSIGKVIARTAKCFGMKTLGFTRRDEDCPDIDAYYHSVGLDDLAAEADYVVSILPDHPGTDRIIDASFLASMKKSAVLINVGRGNAVDDEALIDALNKGEIAGAVLDVFREEPLPSSHPFWKTENLIITSHTAGPSFPADVIKVFIENYGNFREDRPLKHVVDFIRGY